MLQGVKEKIENFYEVLTKKGLVKLTKYEKERLMKRALEFYRAGQDEKLTRMIKLLYYKKDFTLNSFSAWEVDKNKMEKKIYLFKSFNNLQSLEVMLNRGFTAYTSNKKELMEI